MLDKKIDYLLHIIIKRNQMLIQQANTFKSIDNSLETIKDPALFQQLFSKKKKLLDLVQSGKLTGQKYLLICKKTMAEATLEQVKDATQMEMIALGDNVNDWFKDVVDQTKQKIQDQNKILSKIGIKTNNVQKSTVNTSVAQKPAIKVPVAQKPVVKPPIVQKPAVKPSQSKIQSKQPIKQQPIKQSEIHITSTTTDYSKIFSLKVLDNFMQQNPGNKTLYISLYQQKQKVLQLIKQKRITAQIYYQAIEQLLKTTNNQDISFAVQLQIDQLKQFHSGNIQQWFKDRLQSSQQQTQNQKKRYQIFKTGKSSAPTKKNQDIGVQVQSLTKDIKQRVKKANVNLNNYSFSFKFLDNQMEKNMKNPKLFCQIFQQKMKYLELIQKRQIDAQGYRDILGQIIQQSSNQQLKQAAQMQVDLHDLTGQVDDFFQSALEQTGGKLQQQQKLYKKLSGNNAIKLNLGQTTQAEITIEKQAKPDVSEIISFTVLIEYLKKYQKDYDYCTELKEKGAKLFKLIDDKKLGPNQYQRMLQTKLEQIKNKQTLSIMTKQLKKFKQQADISKYFKSVVGQYLEKVKIDLGNRTSYDQKTPINQMTVNEAEPKTKIQYLLRKFGKHQSLYVYYKNNKLQNHLQAYEKQYQLAKKNTLTLCQKIKNGNAKDVDLHQFVDKYLPNITFAVLHRQSRSSFDQKLNQVIERIKKSSAKVTQYTKTLKKTTNRNNFEESQKIIQKNNQNIANLQKLKKQDFIPFPFVQQTQIQMYNLDLNKNLTENQIQIKVMNLQGIRDELLLRIYVIDMKKPRFQAKVKQGMQKGIQPIIKIPPEIMEDIIKGTSKKYIMFTLISKGFFSDSIVASADLQLNFIRTNRMQDRLALKQQKIFMDYIINVHKPKKPIATKIPIIKLTQYPKYEHNQFIEKQFIKTIMPFEKPTQSQIC